MTRRWAIFFVSASLFFLSMLYRATNAVIAPQLMRDLALSTRELGAMSAAFFYAFAAAQAPISLFLDKAGARRLMTGLSMIGAAGAFTFASAHSLGTAMAGRALLGVGMACNLMGTFKLLTVWFNPRSFATLSGIVFSIGTAGNMAAATPLALLTQHVGWRASFCLIGTVNLIMALALYIVAAEEPPRPGAGRLDGRGAAEAEKGLHGLFLLFRKLDYWIISLGTFVRYGVFASFQTLWAGPYLMNVMGLSAVAAGNLILLMNLGLVLGSPTWGALSDRLFKSRKWVVVFGVTTLSGITWTISRLSPGTDLSLLVPLFFCFGLFGSAGSLMYAHIKDLMPIELAGAAMTGVNFFNMIGPAVFLQGLGGFMQTLYPDASSGAEAYGAALLFCAACLMSVSILYLFTREPAPAEQPAR